MRFGVNYTPSDGWFHFWLDPHWDSVERDLAQIADLGMDHIRIFPLWPVLQPNRTWINRAGLEDVRHMVAIAANHGLDAYVDVIQGHLSSFDFVPSWLVSWHETSMFADADAVKAQAELVEALYDALADEPNFKGLTLGNECNQFADRSHPRRMPATTGEIENWLTSLMAPVERKAHDRGRILIHSENDAVWYADGHVFMPRQAANIGDVSAIHSWVFNGTAQHYGGMSEQSVRHGQYLLELAKAFADDPNRPVWLQEIGAPGNVIDERDTVAFCTRSVESALECPGLYGVTWWCSHDVNHAMSDFPPFEHDLGLFDENGEIKPIGREFGRLAREHRHDEAKREDGIAVVIPVDDEGEPILRSACSPGGSLFEAWMDLAIRGLRPAFVTSATAADPEALRARGISRTVTPELQAGHAYSAVSDPSLEAAMAQ
ncbi:glycoside hydrolase 5 family protein [Bifidobacterium eulemuris]|uniref:Glycosyl hydrolase n=1 Tax=Bifidobacterium eulemuris TaxID=1765219 RepID=A0A261GAR8_9BIFI|nr:glycosyl hydrolase [Bifidobacterium eulemuris]OZG68066.1 glycosyl hydrolase [Bifidobacterium eulemuris]QOL31860.1 glycosyl hydrolase [Bifidobacterium eulemuris]